MYVNAQVMLNVLTDKVVKLEVLLYKDSELLHTISPETKVRQGSITLIAKCPFGTYRFNRVEVHLNDDVLADMPFEVLVNTASDYSIQIPIYAS